MQRIRMSLPYFAGFGWEAEVVYVDEKYADIAKDDLLFQSVPTDIKTHRVKAFSKKFTAKFGLGSIALRSLWFYRQKVNSLLRNGKYDLIYFSTTQFPVCILGTYWKKRFNIPYVIDMQDPWHSDYYQNKSREQQPNKYWFSYRLNKYLEPIAIKHADGLISVSENYITDLKNRYPEIKDIPSATITFGAFHPDITIAANNADGFKPLLKNNYKNMVYIGRGGVDMHKAIIPVFEALKIGLKDQPENFSKLKLYFIGTSYAAAGNGVATILPLAKRYRVDSNVIEITDRISYYQTLLTLQQANALYIPGSDDPKYTASKIYPYLSTNKPLLAIFNAQSSALNILQEYGAPYVYSYDKTPDVKLEVLKFLTKLVTENIEAPYYNAEAVEKYSAKQMALQQSLLFDKVIAVHDKG